MVGGTLASAVLPSASPASAAPGVVRPEGTTWSHPHPLAPGQPAPEPVRWVGPARAHRAGAYSSQVASNWAGVIDTGTTFTRIGAQWTVPSVEPSQVLESSGTWIGLDGASASDPTVIQTGTAQATAGGQTAYFAWYELYPSASVVIGGVAPGDQMSALISEVTPGTWNISIKDLTSAQGFSQDFAYGGPGDSAEWIEEAPANASGQIAILADFGSVMFSHLQVGGANLAAATLQFVSMADATGRIVASPSNFDPLSGTFVVTYSGPGPLASGYDLVGSDGGVFVFPQGQPTGFYGSLPGVGLSVRDIAGMVPSPDDRGYFLVGSDGGVFAFGDAPFEGSLPGLGLHVTDIRGIVPTSDDLGYFLVGSDGGVFAFGDAPYLGSVPGLGIRIGDVVGIAATPTDAGYWVVAGDGTVYAFGDAAPLGSASGTPSPVSGIASTPDGGGYWIVTRDGSVYRYGDAAYYGSLPALGLAPSSPVIGLVPTVDEGGYWLIGSDGGIFAFGDAPFVGSLPGLGLRVGDIVGAVPTPL